ncbi:MAG: Gfo/Idh/MocA family protein [Kiritimatiellia bacterium]
MTRIAIAGFGFMGRMHYGNWRRIRGAKVVAICDANLAQLTTVTGGNLAGMDASTDFTGVAVYDDFAKMLAAGGFDAVDVTLPTPLHPAMTIDALKAGYHVLCEKPMALTVKDCDRMLRVAARTGRRLLVAQCLRFWPEYVALRRLVRSGKYGGVVAADFLRASNPPDAKGPHSWFLDAGKSGGCLLDLHIHDADMIASLFGKPQEVCAWTHLRRDGVLDHAQLRYVYPDKVVTATVSWAAAPTLGFEAGFRVTFEGASVVCDAKRKEPFMVYPAKGRPFAPKVPKMNAYEAEQRYFLDLLAGRADERLLTARDARDAIAYVEGAKKIVARA